MDGQGSSSASQGKGGASPRSQDGGSTGTMGSNDRGRSKEGGPSKDEDAGSDSTVSIGGADEGSSEKGGKSGSGSLPKPDKKPSTGEKTSTTAKPPLSGSDSEGDGSDQGMAQALLSNQKTNFAKILNELKSKRKKTSHWIWWVFPTTLAGASEGPPKSKVTKATADYVLSNADIDQWSEILETMFELLKENPMGKWQTQNNKPNSSIIPTIDHGRIGYALIFWLTSVKDSTQKYPRLYQAFKNLQAFDWK